jgi:peptidoglycan hydrolase CwlO-like protein
MTTESAGTDGIVTLRVPSVLTLKDLITIVSVAISLTVAWGVFSTRITVMEREVVQLQTTNKELAAVVTSLQQQVARLNAHQQEDEILIDQLFIMQQKSAPTRRAQ